ncbi:unnamed protein product [Withania somnifera]
MKSYIVFSLSLLAISLQSCTFTLGQNSVSAPAPAPSGPANITKILEKAGQFTTFIRLLKTTQAGDQINTQLNNSKQGMTVFAPTDNAFSSLTAGTLNTLSPQQQVQLVQFHVLPTFISMSQFQTVSNPLRTQAGDTSPGDFPLNVTTSGNQVNVSTGVVDATVANTVYTDVLQPMSIFASPSPDTAPAPAPEKLNLKKKSPETALSPRSGSDDAPGDKSGADSVSGAAVLVIGAFWFVFWL